MSAALFNVPIWTAWTPTLTGFSADPTSATYRYLLIGKICWISIYQGTAGTSSLTSFTISLPFTAATVTNHEWAAAGMFAVDNGATLATVPFGRIASAATSVSLYSTPAFGGWTASSTKKVQHLQMFYQIA